MPAKRKESESEPKQRTPKGLEIPVPRWREVMRDLEKVAKPSARRQEDSASTGEHGGKAS